MIRYNVELYDKDYDVIRCLDRTNDYGCAVELCDLFGSFCKEDEIVRTLEDGTKEPYDWCQVYDTKLKKVMYCAGGIE